jgi:D-alanine-D-alanine ligase
VVGVAVLAGGPSSEHEVSLQTGSEVLAQLRAGGVAARPVFLSRGNAWSFGRSGQGFAELDASAPGVPGGSRAAGAPLPLDDALATLAACGDVAYLGLHGRFGEDGQLQRLLEARGIAFTGSGSQASMIGIDKALSKQAALRVGARCAPGAVVQRGEPLGPLLESLLASVGLPCVAKPVRGGSSVGVTRVARGSELAAAIERAAGEDDTGRALVEGWIDGVEVTCGVLRVGGQVRTLPLIAIRPAGGTFYDYHAKYVAEDTGFECPARLPAPVAAEIERCSAALYAALELRGVARMDFIVGRADAAPCFLELNTLPGFTSHSLVPRAAAAAGLSRIDVLRAVLDDTGGPA